MKSVSCVLRSIGFIAVTLLLVQQVRGVEPPADKLVFDFEDPADVNGWSNLALEGAKEKEPPAKIERSTDHATSGKHSLKLSFAGGLWPTATTESVSQDWLEFKTFKADVTVSRPCVVGFTLLQEKSQRGDDWEPVTSRWTTTAFLKPGKNDVVASLLSPNDYAVHPKWGKAVRFEIFMYRPHDGESIHIDNIRLSNDKTMPEPSKQKFTIHGTDWMVSGSGSAEGCRELGRNLAHLWNAPAARTVEEVEEEFRARHAEFKNAIRKLSWRSFATARKGSTPQIPTRVTPGGRMRTGAAMAPRRRSPSEPGTRVRTHRTRSSCATAAR